MNNIDKAEPKKPRILLGVTGSVDTLLLPHYIRSIRASLDCSISLILTPEASKFVNVAAVGLIVERVIHGENPQDWPTDRPGLIAADHDLMIVLPATANTLSAAATGSALNRLTMMFLVGRFPIMFFPVMGPAMWDKPVVQRNVAMIVDDGHEVIEPAWREQYEPHYGRMYGHYTLPDPDVVVGHIKRKLEGRGFSLAPPTGAGQTRAKD